MTIDFWSKIPIPRFTLRARPVSVCIVILGLSVLAAMSPAAAAEPAYDIILRHGRIIDGTGAPWYYADVALRGGRIAAIGRFAGEASQEINARGLFIAPGFIDMMGQTA